MNILSNKIKFIFPLRLITFWLLFFVYFRILFIIYNYSKIEEGHFLEIPLRAVYSIVRFKATNAWQKQCGIAIIQTKTQLPRCSQY